MDDQKHVWFEMEVTPEEKRWIERLAEQQGTSPKEAVMQLVEKAVGEEKPFKARPGSFLDGIEHLVGSTEGPPDLLRDPDRMEGYGQ